MPLVSESQWLTYNRLQRFPFERPEASNEGSEFLASCFVEPDNFSAILGKADSPTTALLFAARGTGKTACRVMVDYFCRIGNIPIGGGQNTSHVLSIPHTKLHLIARETDLFDSGYHIQSNRLVDDHVREILRQAMPSLSDLLATSPDVNDAVRNFSPALKKDLGWLVLSYDKELSRPQRVFLRELLGDPFQRYINDKGQQEDLVPPSPWDDIAFNAKREASPLDHLSQFTDLLHQIGIPATYVLVDGVDEYMETAADPEKAYQLIRPLLGTLQLMDKTPHLALKFFLPDSIEPLIQADPAVRLDRGFTFQTIHWADNDLIEILRRRIDAVKREEYKDVDRSVTGFEALCVPELRGQIEREMARESEGNPRHLIVLAGLMVHAHFDREIADQENPYQLNRRDWQIALELYKSRVRQHNFIVEEVKPNILQLVEQGENEQIEFKESFRWDTRQEAINRKLEYVIAKTIAAFLNSVGGTLLIGVADNGQIVGIERDLQKVKYKNTDGFYQKLTQTIETYLGIGVTHYISTSFESIENKFVCVIKIKQSRKPVYLRAKNQSEFWFRTGNVTRQLDVKRAHEYIEAHWGGRQSGD